MIRKASTNIDVRLRLGLICKTPRKAKKLYVESEFIIFDTVYG